MEECDSAPGHIVQGYPEDEKSLVGLGGVMFNRNLVVSLALCLVLPGFVAWAALLSPINPPLYLIVTCVLFSPLAAAFFGHAARREFRKSGQGGTSGPAMAATGLTIGYLEIALTVVTIFTGTYHPKRIVAYEASAVGSLQTLNFAARAYAGTHPQEGFPKALKDLCWNGSRPEPDWSIDQVLSSGMKAHYRFKYVAKSTTPYGRIDGYQIYADPIDPKDRESRHFFTDQSGSIRISSGAPANESSTELR
jgi:hypothetical protein